MGDKGKKDKGKREQQKKAQLNPKEKRKLKKEINTQCCPTTFNKARKLCVTRNKKMQ